MVNVHVEPDCANAPKKLFIRDFMIAFANGESSLMLDALTDNVQWQMVGARTLDSKAAIEQEMDKLLPAKVKAMTLTTIVTHGNEGAVNRIMRSSSVLSRM